MLKYNFESNSQQASDTFSIDLVGNYMLKYNFESNSQLRQMSDWINKRWELYAKIQF